MPAPPFFLHDLYLNSYFPHRAIRSARELASNNSLRLLIIYLGNARARQRAIFTKHNCAGSSTRNWILQPPVFSITTSYIIFAVLTADLRNTRAPASADFIHTRLQCFKGVKFWVLSLSIFTLPEAKNWLRFAFRSLMPRVFSQVFFSFLFYTAIRLSNFSF